MPINVKELLRALEQQQSAKPLPMPAPPKPVPLVPPTGNPQFDMAKTLLNKANINWADLGPQKPIDRDSSGPSVISRIFDILSRGNYAAANALKTAESDYQDNGLSDVIREAWEGFAGYDKTTFSDVLQQNFNQQNPEWTSAARKASEAGTDLPEDLVMGTFHKYAGGLGLDLLLDPLNAVNPTSTIKKVGKATGLSKLKHTVTEVPRLATGVAVQPELGSAALNNVLPADKIKSDLNQLAAGVTPVSSSRVTPDLKPADIKYSPQANLDLASANSASYEKSHKNAIDTLMRQFVKDNPELNKTGSFANKRVRKEELKDLANKLTTDSGKFAGYNSDVAGVAKSIGDMPKFAAPEMVDEIGDASTIMDKLAAGDELTFKNETNKVSLSSQILKDAGDPSVSELSKSFSVAKRYTEKVLSKPNPKTGTILPNNPAKQANFTSQIMDAARKTGGKLDAFRMLRAGEDELAKAGYPQQFWDGSKIRLTDVLLELAENPGDLARVMSKEHMTEVIKAYKTEDVSKITNVNIRQAIENLRSRGALSDADAVNSTLSSMLQKKDAAGQLSSAGKLNELQKTLQRETTLNLKSQGVSKNAIDSARQILKDIHNQTLKQTPPLAATDSKKAYIQLYVSGGTGKWLPVQQAQTNALEAITQTTSKALSTRIGESNRAADWFLSRVATWYGQVDLRPSVLLETMTASNNTAARARAWNLFAKNYAEDELLDGFLAAQGAKPAASPKVQEAADYFLKAMENLFSSSGIRDEAAKGASVANRAGITMKDINDQLNIINAEFRFTNKSNEMDAIGNKLDYSKGTDWLNSWERAKIDKPLDFMFQIGTAVEQLMGKYAFYDELAARWGSEVKTSTHSTLYEKANVQRKLRNPMRDDLTKVDKDGKPIIPKPATPKHNRLNGVYFPKDLVPQIDRVMSTWDQIYNPKSPLIRFLDKVIRAWKSGVTIYAPAHHIRNAIGDVYLAWTAGVNNPEVYRKAGKVLWSEKSRYSDLESVENLVSRNAYSAAMTRSGDVITKSGSGLPLTAEQIYIAAHKNGLLVHANVIEELFGDPLIAWKGKEIQPMGGRGKEFAHNVSENREHFMRLAHFIDIIEKSKESNLSKLFENASHEVRKWHPDGTDLTDFERNVVRRMIPFYSWTRKAIPLLIEGAVLNPAKAVVYPKIMEALQGMMGTEGQDRSDPFPLDQLFPDWIRAKGIGPIGEHGDNGLAGLIAQLSRSTTGFDGNPSGYTVANPSNPLIDAVAQYAGMGRPQDLLNGLGQSSTPLFRIPSELLHGETFTGAPIEPGKYITDNVPIAAVIGRIANMGVFGQTKRGEEEGSFNQEALVNFLTALGIQGTGPYIKTSEFQERDRRRELNGN